MNKDITKKSKKLNLGLLAYFVVVVTILSAIGALVYAKYTAQVTGYTNFDVADFHAVILGNNSYAEYASGSTLKAFSEGLDLSMYIPGTDLTSIDFTVANGRTTTKFATTEIEYTLVLRTTQNLPLNYKLVQHTYTLTDNDGIFSENQDTDIEYYTSAAKVIKMNPEDENSKYSTDPAAVNDAYWYEYRFYTDADCTTEKVFSCVADRLDVSKFSLEVEWPIGYLAKVNGKQRFYASEADVPVGDEYLEVTKIGQTNDARYMKEIELMEMLVSVNSPRYDEETTIPGGSSSTPDYYSTGLVRVSKLTADREVSHLVPGDLGEDVEEKIYIYEHEIDLRAFKTVENTNNQARSYEFIINNGNDFVRRDSDNNLIYAQDTNFTCYTLKLMVPYNYVYNNAEFTYTLSINNNGTLYQLTALDIVQYRQYNILVGDPEYNKYRILTQEQATDFIEGENKTEYTDDSTGVINKSKYQVYCVYSFTYSGEFEYIYNLRNVPISVVGETEFNNYAEIKYELKLERDSGNAILDSVLNVLASDKNNRIKLIVNSVFCDDRDLITYIPNAEQYGDRIITGA